MASPPINCTAWAVGCSASCWSALGSGYRLKGHSKGCVADIYSLWASGFLTTHTFMQDLAQMFGSLLTVTRANLSSQPATQSQSSATNSAPSDSSKAPATATAVSSRPPAVRTTTASQGLQNLRQDSEATISCQISLEPYASPPTCACPCLSTLTDIKKPDSDGGERADRSGACLTLGKTAHPDLLELHELATDNDPR
ncbi:hypothetical protein TREES_T100002827 [Tupaia chinensis]|uniref:Uncharacterized protein n=1 Tax=Tupaia chinensis TaxID=246437 RepID=L9KXI4_TUPCH|nr:hypothetical protein TREES_T100002827 [Tupaia chinensis]